MEDYLFFRMCACVNDYLYFYTVNQSVLGKLNINTGMVEYIDKVASKIIGKDDMISEMCSLKKNVYAVTNDGKYLIEFDTVQGIITEVELGFSTRLFGNTAGVFAFNDNIYIYPRDGGVEIIYNVDKKNIVINKLKTKDSISFVCRNGEVAYFVTENNKKILYRNLLSGIMEAYAIDLKNVCGITYDDGKLFLLATTGEVFSWNIVNKKMVKWCDSQQDKAFKMHKLNNAIVVPPVDGEVFKFIDTHKVKIVLKQPFPIDYSNKTNEIWGKSGAACENDEFVFFSMNYTNYIPKIEKKTGKISWIKIIIDNIEKINKIKIILKNRDGYIEENEEGTQLKDFLNLLLEEN